MRLPGEWGPGRDQWAGRQPVGEAGTPTSGVRPVFRTAAAPATPGVAEIEGRMTRPGVVASSTLRAVATSRPSGSRCPAMRECVVARGPFADEWRGIERWPMRIASKQPEANPATPDVAALDRERPDVRPRRPRTIGSAGRRGQRRRPRILEAGLPTVRPAEVGPSSLLEQAAQSSGLRPDPRLDVHKLGAPIPRRRCDKRTCNRAGRPSRSSQGGSTRRSGAPGPRRSTSGRPTSRSHLSKDRIRPQVTRCLGGSRTWPIDHRL